MLSRRSVELYQVLKDQFAPAISARLYKQPAFGKPAKFVRQYGDAASLFRSAVEQYREDVVTRSYPSEAECYHLPKEARSALEAATLTARRKA